jgi:hypothetical protein
MNATIMSKLLEKVVMYTLQDSIKFKGLPMRSKPLSFQLQSEIEALPFEHQEVLMDFISRVRELEYEVDSIHEKLSSIG